jgi:hypothetical protein
MVTIFILALSTIAQAQDWYAMARHGECIILSKVTDRKVLLKGSSTPIEIENKLKKEGVNYSMEPLFDTIEGMLKLKVPSEGLAMTLVQKQFCEEFINR